MRQARDKHIFPTELRDDFLVCGLTSNLELLADEVKNNLPQHQKETHFFFKFWVAC